MTGFFVVWGQAGAVVAEIINRDEFEAKLARLLGRQFGAEIRRLMEALGDPPRIENIPAGFWDDTSAELRGAVVPTLREIYIAQGEAMAAGFSIQPDWALVNTGAVEWASHYGFDLVRGINETTRDGISRAVQAYYRDGLNLGQLEDMLGVYYGPKRAERIAVTEVTRAAVQGERGVADQIMRENPSIEMIPFYVTNADDIVCPICGELDKKQITEEADYPPKHPACRCWVRSDMRVRKE
jgi:hypothetical protein